MTELALSTLGEMRKEESFSKFWASLNEKFDDLDVDEPTLSSRRKMSKRFEPGNAPPEFPTSAKELYGQQYFEALDLVVNCVKDRFNQPGYQVYRHLEDVLLKCVHGDKSYREDIDFVSKFYNGELEKSSLSTQLETFTTLARKNLNDSTLSGKSIICL